MIDNPRFKDAHISLYLCNDALSEILILSEPRKNKEELDFVSSLMFYRATLQYCFNAEYTKLLENKPNKKHPNNHSASLYLLNSLLLEELGDKYKHTFDDNTKLLEQIVSSDFGQKTLMLRDKKFSHKDLDDPHGSSIIGLSDDETAIAIDHLGIMYRVLNNGAFYFDATVQAQVPQQDSRTRNFIRNNAIYKQFYVKHYMQAIEEGFSLNHHR